ncbi:transcriptional activator domain-containing protein [Thiohalospira halophila DSM 15071]|uniref:Transcriptional activator domain-containing protein n=1 Tax=Thiohalospira halophila DSM 15071 TaxID=1123397 RepID=A0A1I1SS36_9GAMM|nr:AAA family ATPase [Thiohalospira halophila]SFD49226.1 transcriptional activator domain-containing protein [Thiohalospira halophila DSM 15071]
MGEGTTVRLELLGPPRARNGETVRPLGGHDKLHLLLFYIAVEGETSRECLLDLFWPDHAAPAARSNLRQVLHKLRHQLGEVIPLTVGRQTVALAPGVTVDVHDFLRLNESTERGDLTGAAALYRGPFLDDCLPPLGLDALEEWTLEWRDHLQALAVDLFRRALALAEAADQRGEWQQLAERLLELEPWEEEAHAALMRRHAADGDTAAVEAQYRRLADVLAEELGTEPGPDLQALRDQLTRGEAPPPPPPPGRPESRRLTALYVDCAAEDAEEALAVSASARTGIQRRVEEWGGCVPDFHGSGVLAWFGYPLPREGAARAAVAAALAILETEPHARAAVHSGTVVISQGNELMGRVPATVVAVRDRAVAGELVASDATRRLVQGYYRCEAMGDGLWRVVDTTGARDRLEARTAPPPPLIGRSAEAERLRRHLEALGRGQGGALMLRGEAGVGKSRLLAEVLATLPERPVVHEIHCSENFQESTYWPVIEFMNQLLGLEPAADEGERHARLARYVGELYADPGAVLARLAPLLRTRTGEERWGTSETTPAVPAGVVGAALADLLERGAGTRPLLLLVEDVHWADSATCELLNGIHNRAGERPTLMLITARPDFRPGCDENMEHLDLAPLGPSDTRALASAVVGGVLDDEALDLVVRFTDGVPLYVEETARMLAAGDDLSERLGIPETLQDLLDARIHRLGRWLPVAQLAASLGRSFQRELLLAISPWDEETVDHGIRALLEEGVVEREQGEGERLEVIRFRHALIQEAAYQSLLPSDREEAHAAIAGALREQFPALARAHPEWVARHLAAAGEDEAAIDHWLRAAGLALHRSAPTEALRHLRQGLKLVMQKEASSERDRQELDYRLVQGSAYLVQGEYASESASAVLDRAYQLCGTVGRIHEVFQVMWCLWHGESSRRGGRSSEGASGRRLLGLAIRMREAGALQRAHYALANDYFFAGEFAVSRHHALQARSWPPDTAPPLGDDPWLMAGAFLAWDEWFLGRAARARRVAEETVAEARRRRPQDRAMALAFQGLLGVRAGDEACVAAVLPELEATVADYRLPIWQMAAEALSAWLAARHGESAAVVRLAPTVAGSREAMPAVVGLFQLILAEAHLALGDGEGALAVLAEEAEAEARYRQGHDRAERRRREGDALRQVHPDQPEQALHAYRAAAEVARGQYALVPWLRAASRAAELGGETDRADYEAALAALEADGEPAELPELTDGSYCPTEGVAPN